MFAITKEQLQNMMWDFKHSTEKVGPKIHPGKTKILSSQSSSRRKEMEIDNIKVDTLTKEASTKYLGQMVTFQQQETTEFKNRIMAAWTMFYKYKQELTSKSHLFLHQLRFRDGDHPNDELRFRNMDTLKRTWNKDSVDAVHNAPLHHANKKKIQEKDTGQKWKKWRRKLENREKRKMEKRKKKKRKLWGWNW